MSGMIFGSPPVFCSRRCAPKTVVASRASPCHPSSLDDVFRDPTAKRLSVDQPSGSFSLERAQIVHSDPGPRGELAAMGRRKGGSVEGRDFQFEVTSCEQRKGGGTPGLLSLEFGGSEQNGASEGLTAAPRQMGQILDFPLRELGGERRSMLRRWDLRVLQEEYAVFSRELVMTAYRVASHAHRDQWRKNGEPVLAHCVETAKILAELNADETTVAAALLHDVLDDTAMTCSELASYVGQDVCGLVLKVGNVSRLSQLVRDSRATLAAVDYSKLKDMLVAVSDARVMLIKLADRVHNMRTISALPQQKQIGIADETLKVFAPLAERLNSWTLKSELEDLSFAVLEPQKYAVLKVEYDELVRRCQNHQLGEALYKLKAALDEEKIVYEDISGRPKNLYGVYKKMQKKGFTSVKQVLDLLAVRVVVKTKGDCYCVLQKVHSLWKSVPGRLKDYIRTPKANGYQSIHEDVQMNDGSTFEVQIRTEGMHYIAEHGLAAHWRYKEQIGAVSNFVAARTLWSQYVLGWVLEVSDKKFRPSARAPKTAGTPIWKTGIGFSDLLGNQEAGTPRGRRATQPYPKPVTEDDFWEPLYVAVSGPDGLEVRQLVRGCTLEEYVVNHTDEDRLPLVNNARVPGSYALRFGDVLEYADDDVPVKPGLDMFTMNGFANLDLGPGATDSGTPRETVIG